MRPYFYLMKIRSKRNIHIFPTLISGDEVSEDIQELFDTEKDLAEVLTESWEVIEDHPSLHEKALKAASRLRDLRLVLKTQGILSGTVN